MKKLQSCKHQSLEMAYICRIKTFKIKTLKNILTGNNRTSTTYAFLGLFEGS